MGFIKFLGKHYITLIVAVLFGCMLVMSVQLRQQTKTIEHLNKELTLQIEEGKRLSNEISTVKRHTEHLHKTNEMYIKSIRESQEKIKQIEDSIQLNIEDIEKKYDVKESDKTTEAKPFEQEISNAIASGLWTLYCTNDPNNTACKKDKQ